MPLNSIVIFGNLNCLGIFAPLKIYRLNIKIDITKRLMVRMAMFLAIVGVAVLLDVYLDNNPAELENIQAQNEAQTKDPGGVYLIAQTGTFGVKTSFQKSQTRKLQVQSHDKFLRKYHQIRNIEVLKAEVQPQTAPIIQSYHYLVFQNYFFTQPDEDPLG